jgi:hypothetical protein
VFIENEIEKNGKKLLKFIVQKNKIENKVHNKY